MILKESKGAIVEALDRLAQSPIEHRRFVIIENRLTGRFVQFCTPPPPSRFIGGPELKGPGPLIFDGTGNGKPGGYELIQEFCDAQLGADFALIILSQYLPEDAELYIIEDACSALTLS